MKIMLIDAFDSFIYTIANYYKVLGMEVKVIRTDKDPMLIYNDWHPDLVVLGPGPGTPDEHGYLSLIDSFKENQAIFGVCLGFQALAMYYGWNIMQMRVPYHGKQSFIKHDGLGIFTGLSNPMKVIRYHSLQVDNTQQKTLIKSTSTSLEDNVIMGIRHDRYPIEGIQFHPESIETIDGMSLIKNSLRLVKTPVVDLWSTE